jgi:hypothetical protein
VIGSAVFPGCSYEHFFDTVEKANYFVSNVLGSLNFTGRKMNSGEIYRGASKLFWDKVCGGSQLASSIFTWLRNPGGRVRPDLALFGEYSDDEIDSLKKCFQDNEHCKAIGYAWDNGILHESFFRHIARIRTVWESNRYRVALLYDSADEVPTKQDVDANVTYASSLGISKNVSKAVICLKSN